MRSAATVQKSSAKGKPSQGGHTRVLFGARQRGLVQFPECRLMHSGAPAYHWPSMRTARVVGGFAYNNVYPFGSAPVLWSAAAGQ